ncbi:hypothetical protein [Streptomyces virginiae]|uniref:hypothetical protein n=1 Tax=Streptomyces virginiae TaxID=1961 RepID=UPI003693F5AB
MTNRFEYTDEFGQRLAITPVEREQADEAPALWFTTTDGGWGGTSVKVPLDKLEEAIAGQRDMARQAGGQPAPLRRRLTEPEHDRAWHAIEGLDWKTADPDTVLNSVLRALHIDPPASPLAGARIAAEALRQAAQSTQDDFGLATGSAGPTATEGAGA